MKDEYDFSQGKRSAVIPSTGKTRITIYEDSITESLEILALLAKVLLDCSFRLLV